MKTPKLFKKYISPLVTIENKTKKPNKQETNLKNRLPVLQKKSWIEKQKAKK